MAERGYARERLRPPVLTDSAKEPVQFREWRVPRWFDARLSHPDWPTKHAVSDEMAVEISISVDPDNGPVLTGVRGERGSTITYRDAAALLASTIDLNTLVWDVMAIAIAWWAVRQFGPAIVGDLPPETPLSEVDPDVLARLAQLQSGMIDTVREAAGPRRRRIVTPALLREVAEVYRGAHAAGNPPTVAVQEHFNTSHRNAARWVAEARKAGILGPATGTKPGELGDDDS